MQQQRVTEDLVDEEGFVPSDLGELKQKVTLFSLSGDLRDLEKCFDELDPDDTEAHELIYNTYFQVAGDRNKKIESWVYRIKNRQARERFLADRIKTLQLQKGYVKHDAERMLESLKWEFSENGLKMVEAGEFRVSLQNNGGKRKVDVFDTERVPARFKNFSIDGDMMNKLEGLILGAMEQMDGDEDAFGSLLDASQLLASLPVTGIPLAPIGDAIEPPKDSMEEPIEVPGAQLLARGQSIRIK